MQDQKPPRPGDEQDRVGGKDAAASDQVSVGSEGVAVQLEKEEVPRADRSEFGVGRGLPEVDLVDVGEGGQKFKPIIVGDANVEFYG